jgi:hypothetical protein
MQKNCEKGHSFYKTSDCPVCPICEREKEEFFIPKLSAPARRALEKAGIDSLEKLSRFSEKDLLRLHGFGKTAIPIVLNLLNENVFKMKK